MRTILIIAAGAIMATGATARTTHRRPMMHADSGSATTRALNEKSLQQASAAGSMGNPSMNPSPMSDSGTPMTPPTSGSPATLDASPTSNDMAAPAASPPAPQ